MPKYSAITEDDEWFAGEDKGLEFTIEVDGDITGWNLQWVLRVAANEPGVMIEKITPTGITLNPSNKTATVNITAEDTADMETGEWFHSLKRTDEGSEGVLAYGEANLRQAATR